MLMLIFIKMNSLFMVSNLNTSHVNVNQDNNQGYIVIEKFKYISC